MPSPLAAQNSKTILEAKVASLEEELEKEGKKAAEQIAIQGCPGTWGTSWMVQENMQIALRDDWPRSRVVSRNAKANCRLRDTGKVQIAHNPYPIGHPSRLPSSHFVNDLMRLRTISFHLPIP